MNAERIKELANKVEIIEALLEVKKSYLSYQGITIIYAPKKVLDLVVELASKEAEKLTIEVETQSNAMGIK